MHGCAQQLKVCDELKLEGMAAGQAELYHQIGCDIEIFILKVDPKRILFDPEASVILMEIQAFYSVYTPGYVRFYAEYSQTHQW